MVMKLFNLKTTCIIFFFSILTSIIIHWVNLSKRVSEIEKLENVLIDIRKTIPKETRISFQTNLIENSPKLELYFQTQFVMCPIILAEQSRDTFLFIEKGNLPFNKLENVDTIATSNMYDMKVALLKKHIF
jgi:hypothetical protein